MTKGFQEKKITAPTTSVDFVGPPCIISVSGIFSIGTITFAITGDSVTYGSYFSTVRLLPAGRVTVSIRGGFGNHDVTVKCYPLRQPY